jgi:periplasmic divalent cation tolerance protein
MGDQIVIALTTLPGIEIAQKIARELVELKLAACANIIPDIGSVYRWEGKLESSTEFLVLFKLTAACYANFEAKLKSLHPYDVPEIICVNVTHGLPDYLRWVAESCTT